MSEGLNGFFEQMGSSSDDAMQILLTDFYRAWQSEDFIGARAILNRIKIILQANEPLKFISGVEWLKTEPPAPDQVLVDLLDMGDKCAIIGSSKMRKSFFMLQLIVCLAAGRPFLDFEITQCRRCAYIQFELRDHHVHRRFRRLCDALGILSEDVEDRLLILNARGLGLAGESGIERMSQSLLDFRPEVIAFDPLYKLSTGVENAAEDMKLILGAFDTLAESTGAAVLYIHHDIKGQPGDRDIRDRGAGSNVLGRDYDVALTMTAHATDEEAIVIDYLCRNYPPRDPVVIQWGDTEITGYLFGIRRDLLPDKRTSANARKATPIDAYLPAAEEILAAGVMDIATFKDKLKQKTGAGRDRIQMFVSWATAGGSPKLETRQSRARGEHKKWIGLPGAFNGKV